MEEPLLLLVEDESLVLIVAQEALEAGGYAVLVATHGNDALIALDDPSVTFSGLLTDVCLGNGPDGWDIARHARKLRADLPIVYMTGDSAAEWPIQGVPNSVLVQKPYAPAQLLTAISTLLMTADSSPTS